MPPEALPLQGSSSLDPFARFSWRHLHNVFACLCRDFASAEATRGQWKQTKSAVAPLTPSQCTLLFIDLYCCLGTNGTPTKFVSIKLNKLRWGREAVQRATAKPSGRLRRGEISLSTRESSMKEKSTQSRERVKGGDFVPFHSPLRSPEAEPLVGSRGKAPWVTPSTSPQSARKHLSGFPSRSAARCACRSSCRCRKSAGHSENRTCPRRIRPSAAACRRGSRRRGP